MKFCDKLRLLIEERNITQKQVALELNMAPSTIGGYVQGMSEPDFETLKLLAKYFHVSIDYLLDYHAGIVSTHWEDEMLRVFRSLSEEQQAICVEQCKAFLRMKYKE